MLEKRYDFKVSEPKWQQYWADNRISQFNPNSEGGIYTIDTPPPTVNGKIHVGHLSSYTHIEVIARYHRMKGESVYFPFGYDDNGLPTERYVEKRNKVKAYEMKRQDFIDLCLKNASELEEEFFNLYKTAGFSCEMEKTYSSISKNTQKISQESFLELLKKGFIYHAEAPALWCTECRTSVAQSELDTVELDSIFNYLKFYIDGTDQYVVVATTRPEMLPACVCVFINPKDTKNSHLIGKQLRVPHFNFLVPVYTDELVDMEKGSGVVMCCTFGDNVDKEWQRKHKLPIKECFNNGGKMTELAGEFAGMHISKARPAIIAKLKEQDLLIKQDEIVHPVSTHERCGTPIEIVVKKQWFIDVLNHKQRLLQAGHDLNWYPDNMRNRFLNWVENLQWNWCISRQRYFGVPFPVWFCERCGKVKTAEIEDLPVDPQTDSPKTPCSCGCTSFLPENDVMDTWATSSLTPQISCDLITNEGLSDSMVPMNLRPNAHDNIRVWDFYTVVKSLYHFNKLPWKDLMISGFVTSSTGGKLAKSKGNSALTPQEVISRYSADVTRYWAGTLTLGKDTAFALDAFDSGKKLVNKIWNASRFVLSFLTDYNKDGAIEASCLMDRWILAKFAKMQKRYIELMDKYDIANAINELEHFFWGFCDNYIEIVKDRLYKPEVHGIKENESGKYTAYTVLLGMLKLFSPVLPHVTEEIFMSSLFCEVEKARSIHSTLHSVVPQGSPQDIADGDTVVDVVTEVRRKKSLEKVTQKTEVSKLVITAENIDSIKSAEMDISTVCNVSNIQYNNGKFAVEVGDLILETTQNSL